MAGPGESNTMFPWTPGATVLPPSATILVLTPGSGRAAHPGLKLVSVGAGERMVAPVSDCHHVSTTGAVPAPTFSRSQRQASGLTASPTVPRRRMEDRL